MAETRTIQTVQQEYKSSDGTKLYLSTVTNVEVDSNGKYLPGTAKIQLREHTGTGFLGTDYKTVATRNAGESWKLTKDGNGNTVAGKDLQKTLANKNSMMNINLNNHISGVLQAPLQGVPAGKVNTNNQSSANAAIGAPPPATPATPNEFNLDDVQSTADAALEQLNKEIEAIGRKYYGNWKYPIDFPKDQDRLKFTMFAYSPKSFNTSNASEGLSPFGDRSQPQAKDIMGTVTLPISPTISDLNTVDWGSAEMNAIEAIAAASSLNIITKGAEGAAQAATDVATGLQSSTGALKTAAGVYLAGQAAGGNKGFLSRVTGSILNPNLELLFNGPQLRTFSFSFMLSAREPDEAKQIRNIIRFFKQGMSVKRAKPNLFLKAPNIFNISYQLGEKNEDHPWINKIKTCALTSCQVNYTPAGNYATFYDGAMTAYEITLSFSELEPIFDDDYDDDPGSFDKPDTSIGY